VREVVDLIDVFHESYVLELPPAPDDAPAWDLILTVSRREFVSRLEITAVDGAGRRTAILTGGSAFRLPASDAERLRFPLPMRDIARLELDLENREAGFLEPRFTLEASRMLPVAGASSVDLGPAERFDLARVTELVVDRPRGLVPRRLAISTASDTFHRRVTVWDEGPGADPSPLGSAEVFRVAAIAPVEQLEIPVRPPRGDRLRLVIEDEDSPPLNGVAIAALMPRPVLVFSLPDGASSATLYFGGGRARRPRYDIAAFDHPLPAAGEDAHQALAVLDPARSRIATLGAI
jgi:hypothetical protein